MAAGDVDPVDQGLGDGSDVVGVATLERVADIVVQRFEHVDAGFGGCGGLVEQEPELVPWVIPMLLALWRGPMSRNELFEAVGTYRPESNLTPAMFSRTAQHLEDNGFVVINRAPGHPDTQEGATYTITDQARSIIPPLRDALLLFAEQAADSNSHRVGGAPR